ncbi:MAG: hypothetical protein CME63_10665 [Halobacteriovoraceae bacterium]|nr:hypothetical protein [Halobacteriovoraceae bacterium]MBC98204.1 hypothetical protein [Halobacteriovoraceae bacterium]|tara:strand:+ start:100594 stop:100776 length:183 start_codon:yes stop_codon:yes gene_type:complete
MKAFYINLKKTFTFLKEVWTLIVKNKKWWLIPFFILLCMFALMVALVGGGAILPAIYAIF